MHWRRNDDGSGVEDAGREDDAGRGGRQRHAVEDRKMTRTLS